jgi:hypothetical protein
MQITSKKSHPTKFEIRPFDRELADIHASLLLPIAKELKPEESQTVRIYVPPTVDRADVAQRLSNDPAGPVYRIDSVSPVSTDVVSLWVTLTRRPVQRPEPFLTQLSFTQGPHTAEAFHKAILDDLVTPRLNQVKNAPACAVVKIPDGVDVPKLLELSKKRPLVNPNCVMRVTKPAEWGGQPFVRVDFGPPEKFVTDKKPSKG